jgi:hypothetical protein
MICPVCGSDEDKISTTTNNVDNHWFGIPFSYQAITNTCSWCGAEGDFTGMNDIKITEAIKTIQTDSGHEYIDTVMDLHKLSHVSIDMLLGLDIGSTGKMRVTNLSQIEFLFFRMLKEYPQVLRVLERWKIKP